MMNDEYVQLLPIYYIFSNNFVDSCHFSKQFVGRWLSIILSITIIENIRQLHESLEHMAKEKQW